jgi:hypothetical protein
LFLGALGALMLLSYNHPASAQDWRPTPELDQAATRHVAAYYSAKARKDYPLAFSLVREGAMGTYDDFVAANEKFNGIAGDMIGRKIVNATWYKDRPNMPGLYVAFDFTGQFRNIARYCGFVVLQQQPSGNFMVLREEQNFLERAMEEKIKAAGRDVAQVWAQLAQSCPSSVRGSS